MTEHSNGNHTRYNGRCKWFSDEQGFGFILDEETQKEIFVHHKNIVMDGRRVLFPDEAVQFELGEDRQGRKQAMVVTRMGQAVAKV